MTCVTFTLAGAPPLPNQTRGRHWSSIRSGQWRQDAFLAACRIDPGIGRNACVTVTLTRAHTRGQGPDYDNLVASLKSVRDGVADRLFRGCTQHWMKPPCGHLHDDEPNVTWRYAKRKGLILAVEVEVDAAC